MSLCENFEDVQVGDKVIAHRGRGRDVIVDVYHVTPKQFSVSGFGKIWKKNGKGVGDADSWFGTYIEHITPGDVERINAETTRIANRNLFSECRVRDFNDDELARAAAIVKECNARREAESEAAAQ